MMVADCAILVDSNNNKWSGGSTVSLQGCTFEGNTANRGAPGYRQLPTNC